ncbi:MAG TPA: NAD(P)-dependent oxidoreductase [Hypericibacter adhaerens]|uniref:NAD-dependent epimerase/dehydratase family protein n=1 Tax=Hypericibacter adhaerens TaxID=2602016 RepID=UPI002C317C17|nr:NAD(P)-dependent oxidoreductase [Hypericibacter adhaerens]HWA45945.1 NAD(P)-dependent oxidoreductase [Hypericibacter adhaerens]
MNGGPTGPLAAVTGASGFVGSAVASALDGMGWRLRLLIRRQPPRLLLANQSPEVVIGDLGDNEALGRLVEGADAVLHVAGVVKALDREGFMRGNAEPTGRLAAIAARQATPPHFVLMSSLAAREPALSPYCASKRAGEDALKAAAGAMAWTILRPTAVYGPGDRELLPFFKTVKRGFAPRPPGAIQRLSLIHVEDLGRFAAASAGLAAAKGQTWELDDGAADGHGWAELTAAAAAALGTHPIAVTIPRPLLKATAQANALKAAWTGKPQMLVPHKLPEMLHADWLCHHRPPASLGTKWEPKWAIGPGFADTVRWYRREGWL